jgi:hypothetical protein
VFMKVSLFDGTIMLFDPKVDEIPLTGRTGKASEVPAFSMFANSAPVT